MTIIASAKPIGQPALAQDDTLTSLDLAAFADQPCPPFCVVTHADADADLDPGVAWHQGNRHVIAGTVGDAPALIELQAERFDGTRKDEPANGWLTARSDGQLSAADLRRLAAAALAVAAQVDPDNGTSETAQAHAAGLERGRRDAGQVAQAAVDAAFGLGWRCDPKVEAGQARVSALSFAQLLARIEAGPVADPWFAVRQLADGNPVPTEVLAALRMVGGGAS